MCDRTLDERRKAKKYEKEALTANERLSKALKEAKDQIEELEYKLSMTLAYEAQWRLRYYKLREGKPWWRRIFEEVLKEKE